MIKLLLWLCKIYGICKLQRSIAWLPPFFNLLIPDTGCTFISRLCRIAVKFKLPMFDHCKDPGYFFSLGYFVLKKENSFMDSVHETPASPETYSAEQPQNHRDVIRRIVLIVLSALLFFGLAGVFSKKFLFEHSAMFAAGGSDVTEMKVLGVVMDSLSETPAVFLYSEKEEIFLPIWIGANEAVAIQAELAGVKSPRPLTNDLLKDVIEKLEATLEKIVITKVQDDTYYSILYIKGKNGSLEIDARPSDALGLAIRFKCPIWVNDDIVKKYGMSSQDAAKKRLEKSKKI